MLTPVGDEQPDPLLGIPLKTMAHVGNPQVDRFCGPHGPRVRLPELLDIRGFVLGEDVAPGLGLEPPDGILNVGRRPVELVQHHELPVVGPAELEQDSGISHPASYP